MIAICFLYLFFSYSIYAQDEAWLVPKNQIQSLSQSILLNLDKDTELESLSIKKINGLDFIEIKKNNKKIYENKFQVNGLDSHVSKMKRYVLTEEKSLLLFYYDEGYNNWRYLENIHYIYLLTYNYQKLSDFNFQKLSIEQYQQKLPKQPFEKNIYDISLSKNNRLIIERDKIKRSYTLRENSWVQD